MHWLSGLLSTGLLLVMPTLAAQELYIAAAAHSSGVGGARWRTDLEVRATGSTRATIVIDLLQSGQDNSSPRSVSYTVAAGTSARYQDLLGTAFSHTGNAGLRLVATSGSILANSRTYNDDPAGTYGQFIPAEPLSAAFAAGQRVALIHLSRSADATTGYRTNIGFLNLTGTAIDLEVALFTDSGASLGSPTYRLLPFEQDQVTDIFSAVAGSAEVADGFAVVTSATSGARYLAYASVIDNRSADAVYIPGQVMPAPVGGERLQPDDFAYAGAFALPGQFDWGARGLAYSPAGASGSGSLYVTGNDLRQAEVAEVAVPQLVITDDWQELTVATLLSPLRDFDDSIVTSVAPTDDAAMVSGIEVVPRQGSQSSDKLYGAIDNWYGVVDESHPTIWFSELDGSNPRGPLHVGPWDDETFHGNRAGDFLFTVPASYADRYLGGRALITGKTRGAFHGSMGPTLLAFRPWPNDSVTPLAELDAVAILWYRLLYPECAGPNLGDPTRCDYPGFTMCDKWEGGAFLDSSAGQAVILLGTKGLGSNHYGAPPSAGTCESDQGYHCDPFERQVIFYDVDELGAAARGTRDPWTVVPYAVWRPQEFFLGDAAGQTCGKVGEVAVDRDGRRVFMTEKGLGGNNSAVVHVWTLP